MPFYLEIPDMIQQIQAFLQARNENLHSVIAWFTRMCNLIIRVDLPYTVYLLFIVSL
jgi:hypothetical protein